MPLEEIKYVFSNLELNDVVSGVDEAMEHQKFGRWLAIEKVLTTCACSPEA